MQLYSKKVLEHFRNPKNLGEIKNPDGVATVGNPVCGDVMKMYIKVKRKTQNSKLKTVEYIEDIKFQTLGCAAAIATSSVVTEMVKGKTLWEAKMIKEGEVIKSLGGLPKQKIHCSVLAVRALKKAIENYENKKQKNEELKRKVEKVLRRVKAGIEAHGGGVDIESVKKGVVRLKIKGACIGCPMAKMTFEEGVGKQLKKIRGVRKVEFK